MRLRILPSALQDLRNGWHFYEAQNHGLGDYFQDSLFADIDSLVLYAGMHPVHHGHHRLLAKRFPFGVYYTVENGKLVTVCRVLDMRRRPSSIKRDLI
jgi:plasmid stabilization system protein ParE